MRDAVKSASPCFDWKPWFFKIVRFVLITVLFGWFYGWASPRCFPQRQVGFTYGMLHGALMPMALPALVMGNNVDIFASENSGRYYKIGYIVGINLCGLVFFGSIFLKPKAKPKKIPDAKTPGSTTTSSEKCG